MSSEKFIKNKYEDNSILLEDFGEISTEEMSRKLAEYINENKESQRKCYCWPLRCWINLCYQKNKISDKYPICLSVEVIATSSSSGVRSRKIQSYVLSLNHENGIKIDKGSDNWMDVIKIEQTFFCKLFHWV